MSGTPKMGWVGGVFESWHAPGFDSLMHDFCAGHGYCGGLVNDVPTHVTDFIPQEGTVSADQFVTWLFMAEGDSEDDRPMYERHRARLREMFVHNMGADIVDASRLKWSGMTDNGWPGLDWAYWRDTAIGLQLRTQIVGKVRLALTPWLNHSWHVPLYVSARGLTTSPIFCGGRILEIAFDFLADALVLATSDGEERRIPLAPGSIAGFHAAVLAALADLGIPVAIDGVPSEMPDPVPFADDHAQRPYDAEATRDFWRALIQATRVLNDFRTGFLGKASPTHFFWGSFDLASTRFSGRAAPRHPGGVPGLPDDVTVEAYSDEESSLGFWPGSDAYPQAAFYAYAYPAPAGYTEAPVAPEAAHYDAALGEFILPYNAVRTATDPDAALLAFCHSTYDAAATLGAWDRAALECPLGRPKVPRVV